MQLWKDDFSLQQEHRIDVLAMASGARGEVEFTVELTALTQTINLS